MDSRCSAFLAICLAVLIQQGCTKETRYTKIDNSMMDTFAKSLQNAKTVQEQRDAIIVLRNWALLIDEESRDPREGISSRGQFDIWLIDELTGKEKLLRAQDLWERESWEGGQEYPIRARMSYAWIENPRPGYSRYDRNYTFTFMVLGAEVIDAYFSKRDYPPGFM